MAVNDEDSKISSDLTKSDRFDFKFRWKIGSFMDFPGKTGDYVDSEDFGGDTVFLGVKWHINGVAFPKGNGEHEDFLGVYLVIEVTPAYASLGITAHYKVALIGFNGKKKFTQRISQNNGSWDLGLGRPTFANLKILEELEEKFIPNGNLTLEFEGTAYIRFDPVICKPLKRRFLTLNFEIPRKLWEIGICSDVLIKAGDRDFKCHKCILSVRSEYFWALFQSEMKDNRKSVLDFSHKMNGEELECLLEYLYLGKTRHFNNNSQTMLKVAEMFRHKELKSISEKALIDQLTPRNAWKLANLAWKHGAKNLRKEANLLLAKNPSLII